MMTKLLYLEDPYCRECTARVKEIVPLENGKAGIVLDHTCFFPRGGGAQGDFGWIEGLATGETISDRETGALYHPASEVEAAKLVKGSAVHIRIDWAKRFGTMRLHSTSHIMEHFLMQVVPGLTLLGTNVNENRDSSTYSGPEIEIKALNEVNRLVNAFIGGNVEIETYPDKERAGFRYWKAGDIIMPCGGVHPRNTSEIGPVFICRKRGGKRQELRTELVKTFNSN